MVVARTVHVFCLRVRAAAALLDMPAVMHMSTHAVCFRRI